MSLENIFYVLGIVSFAFFIIANLFIVAVTIKIYIYAKHQAEIINDKSEKIFNLVDIITSQKTKTVVTIATTTALIFRLIKKARKG